MIPTKDLKKYFLLNGTHYLYDIKGSKYRIRWCYAGGTYSNPRESGKCKRTIEFRENIIAAYIKKYNTRRIKNDTKYYIH